MIKLRQLLNEETFTATNKQSGKTSVFKSKDSRDAAIKAGTHNPIKDKGDSNSNGSETPKVNIFNKSSKTEPKSTSNPASLGVDKVVYNTRTKTVGIVRMADERGETKTDADGNVNTSELEPYNPTKYPHQKDAKVAPSTQKEVDARGLWKPFAKDDSKEEPKSALKSGDTIQPYGMDKYGDFVVDKVFKNKDGETSYTGKFKNSGEEREFILHDKDKINSEEPKSEPAKKRPGNPQVNKATKSKAEELGVTPQKLGNKEYPLRMLQAAYEALTDSNYHTEARELIAKIEGKPEMAEKPDYPSMKDPQYKEKMAVISQKYASKYSDDVDDNARELGTSASQESGWDGVQAADAIAFTLRMNGFHKQADLIQSVFDNKPYMKNEGRISLSKLVNESEAEEIANLTGLRTQAVKKFIDDNNINDRKLLAYLKIKGPKTLSNRMDMSTAIVGKPGNKYQQGIIKAFSK